MKHSRLAAASPTAIRVTRRFAAPPERVFRAWLDPAAAGTWLFATALQPATEVEIDARVGGSFRFACHGDGPSAAHTGRYLEIVPHRRLVFTLSTADRPAAVSRVTVEIAPRKRGCELTLVQERVPQDRAHQTEARWTGMLYGLGATRASARRPPVDSPPARSTRV
jgi:uncharacterized protein YndB with AHSA1/START domain